MPLPKPTYQLTLALDIPEEDQGAKPPSPREAALLREQARQVFDEMDADERPSWYEDFEQLMLGGWPFRVAAYIAWASSPRQGRQPGTLKELASMLGLKSTNAIHTWRRKNPAIDQQVALLQAAPLFKHRRERFEVLDRASLKADEDYKFFPYLKLAFEMSGDYVPRSQLDLGKAAVQDDLEELDDADLQAAREMGLIEDDGGETADFASPLLEPPDAADDEEEMP